MNRSFTVLLLAIFYCVHAFAAADFDKSFQKSTFETIIKNNKVKGPCNYCIDMRATPYRIGVTYTGIKRPILGSRNKFIQTWLGSIQKLIGNEDLYSFEIQVTENGKEYWLPFQKQLVPYLVDELPKGGSMEIDIRWIGVLNAETQDEDYVFVVIDFKSL